MKKKFMIYSDIFKFTEKTYRNVISTSNKYLKKLSELEYCINYLCNIMIQYKILKL